MKERKKRTPSPAEKEGNTVSREGLSIRATSLLFIERENGALSCSLSIKGKGWPALLPVVLPVSTCHLRRFEEKHRRRRAANTMAGAALRAGGVLARRQVMKRSDI